MLGAGSQGGQDRDGRLVGGVARLVTVTGASGHLGGNLVRTLLERGDRVRVLIRGDTQALDGLDVERFKGDVLEPGSLRSAFAGSDAVYHLAAMISITGDRGGAVSAVNVQGAYNAARAALDTGVRRFVHCSSIHAYRLRSPSVIDESSARSEGPDVPAYDASKWRGEQQVQRCVADGLDAVIVNPTGILGPYDFRPSRMGRLLLDLHRRKLPTVVTGGFDWIDVRDVVAGLLAAEERGKRGHNYLLSGHWHTLRELADQAERITGVRAPRITAPLWLARLGVPFAKGAGWLTKREPLFTNEALEAVNAPGRVSNEKARRELELAAPRALHETLRDTYAWFGAEHRLK